MDPLQVNDTRDAKAIEWLEKVFGIRDYEENKIHGLRGETYWLRRAPQILSYAVWDKGVGPLGYIVIGETREGRIVMQPQARNGIPLGKPGDSLTVALRRIYDYAN